MAIGQFVYDALHYPATTSNPGLTLSVSAFIQLLSGIAVALYSNIMASCVLFVIFRRKTLNVLDNVHLYHAVVAFVCVGLAVMAGIAYFQERQVLYLVRTVYIYLRVLSVGYNFVVCGLAYFQVHQIMGTVTGTLNNKTNRRLTQDSAICILAKRMMYYPIVQAISRSGAFWYEVEYGWDFDPAAVTRQQFACQCYLAVVTPAAGVGYCVIYILMQPQAYQTLMGWLRGRTGPEVGEWSNPVGHGVDNPLRSEVSMTSRGTGSSAGSGTVEGTGSGVGSSRNTGDTSGRFSRADSFNSSVDVDTQGQFTQLSHVSDTALMLLLEDDVSADTPAAAEGGRYV
jgi:hypothetical protein